MMLYTGFGEEMKPEMRICPLEDGVDALSDVWINWFVSANLLDKQLEPHNNIMDHDVIICKDMK
jgi:hypothetical protein